MAKSSIIKAIIVADIKNFADGLKKTGKSMDDWGKTLTRRVSLPLAAAGVAAIKMGSDLAEASSMASQVFGDAADDIVAQSKNITDSFSQEEYLSMAGNLGDIAQGMGFTADASADLSKDVLELSQDLGSFKNLPTEQAVKAITSAMTGEREALKGLGIVVNEEMVNQQALAMGLGDTTGKLSQQEKATATLALVTDQSARAIGDWDRTSDGAAGQAKILQANMKDMAAELGQNLLPIAETVLGWATDISAVFADMGSTTQIAILGFAGVALALGPIISMAQRVVTAFAAMKSAAILLAGGTGFGAVIGAVAAVTAGLVWLTSRQKVGEDVNRSHARSVRELTSAAQEYKATLDATTGATTETTRELLATGIAQAGLTSEFMAAGLTIDDMILSLEDSTSAGMKARDEIDIFARSLKENESITDDQTKAFLELRTSAYEVGRQAANTEQLLDPLGNTIEDVGNQSDTTRRKFSELVAELLGGVQTQSRVNLLFDETKQVLENLDGMSLGEIQGEVFDLTGDLATLWEGATEQERAQLMEQFGGIAYGLLLIGNQAGLTTGQVQALRDMLNTVKVPEVIGGRFNNAVGMGATGGIVTRPTLAVIGEAGPEAVVPLNRTPGSSPLPGGMGGGGGPVHVTLQVDGRVLAEVVADANRDAGGVFV